MEPSPLAVGLAHYRLHSLSRRGSRKRHRASPFEPLTPSSLGAPASCRLPRVLAGGRAKRYPRIGASATPAAWKAALPATGFCDSLLQRERVGERGSKEDQTSLCKPFKNLPLTCSCSSCLQGVGNEGVLRSDGLDLHTVGVPKGPAPGATPRPFDLEGAQAIVLFDDQIDF